MFYLQFVLIVNNNKLDAAFPNCETDNRTAECIDPVFNNNDIAIIIASAQAMSMHYEKLISVSIQFATTSR